MDMLLSHFQHIGKTAFPFVGGKAASLGELARIKGINVPDGFFVTTEAFKRIVEETPAVNELLHQLSLLQPERRDAIGQLGAEIRKTIETKAIPDDIHEAVGSYLEQLGADRAYAVRSSATAEDLPTASFAGQQDTYLNITGKDAIMEHVRKCWASLFTDRAIIYRMQQGFDHRNVQLAVIVQHMVFPQASGVLFTADPVSSNRKVLSIDACFGLGEALVSGRVNADNYKLRDHRIIDKKIAVKSRIIRPLKNGGTEEQHLEQEQQHAQVLTDEQMLQLEDTGRTIEAHFGCPQDIEWCLANDMLYIVQSRPITTLFPIPDAGDEERHVYISVGHQQMMTDAMKPLGLSVWQLSSGRSMYHAGGRLFVDVAPQLADPADREMIVNVLGKSDPLIRGALKKIVERDFIKLRAQEPGQTAANGQGRSMENFRALNDYDPAIVDELIRSSQAAIAALQQQMETRSGVGLFDYILEDIRNFKQSPHPQSFGVIMTAMNAASWINEKMEEWLGEKNAADKLSQSLSNNITSEMGRDLLDVSDVIRPYPEVISYLQQVKDERFLERLDALPGGKKSRHAIEAFLGKYGMRCPGEIDITRKRWREDPAALVPMILANIRNLEPGESKRKFEQGLQEAAQKERELLARLKQLPDGDRKATETKRMIGLVRHLAGYREYPKYTYVNRYFIYKQALLKEAVKLVQAGVIGEQEDIYYLSLEELREVVRTGQSDGELIRRRRDAYERYKNLMPPRVMTSEGEIITGAYDEGHLPAGAIAGLAVSSGMAEGRARVILNMEDADLEEGDILVTRFTDPSWTPLFISIKGLVTEVGGLMTHGAVIAREYGLPAVVGVEHATQLIKDGQRIRVHGTEGYVELL